MTYLLRHIVNSSSIPKAATALLILHGPALHDTVVKEECLMKDILAPKKQLALQPAEHGADKSGFLPDIDLVAGSINCIWQ